VEGDVAMTAFVLAALAECKCGGVVCELQSVPYNVNNGDGILNRAKLYRLGFQNMPLAVSTGWTN